MRSDRDPKTPPARRAATILATAAFVALVPHEARAQSVKETLEITRQAAETQRRVIVSGSLPLTDSQAKAFWPVYDDYEKERRSIDERANRLVSDFVASYAKLSDSQARTMLAEAIKVDEEHLALRRSYTARMGKLLPPRLLVRFFQIENKLDAVIKADIARQIPLVQ